MNITTTSDNPPVVTVTLPQPNVVNVIGIPGPPGPEGPAGPPGSGGSVAVDGIWFFDTDPLLVEPGPGFIGCIGDSPETISGLYIHEIDADGVSRHGSLNVIQNAIIRMGLEGDPLTVLWVFSIEALGYSQVTHTYSCNVTLLSGVGESFPADNSRFVVRIFPQLAPSEGGGGLTVYNPAGVPIPTTDMRGDGNVKYTDLGGATGVYADVDSVTMENASNKIKVKYPVPLGGAIGDILTKTGSANGVMGWAVPSGAPVRKGPIGRWVAACDTMQHQPYGAGAGIIRLSRVYLDVGFDAIGMQVETGVAGSNFRIGIYNSSPTDGRPTNLATPQIQIDTSTNGVKTYVHGFIPPGLYWFGSVPSVSLTIRAQVNNASPNIPTASSTLTMLQNSWYISGATMPDPFPSSGEGGSGDVALFYVRIAA